MKSPANARRLIAGILLGGALVMLTLGVTLFADRLRDIAFVFYWLTCFLLTGMAALLAVIDMALIRRQQRREQQELIATTLREAEAEKAKRTPPGS